MYTHIGIKGGVLTVNKSFEKKINDSCKKNKCQTNSALMHELEVQV